jgi:hypothetical protein
MNSPTDHAYEGHDQTASASPDARGPDGAMMPRQRRTPLVKRSNENRSMEAVPWMAEAHIEAPGESMQTPSDPGPYGDAGPPTWRPQPGEVLTGVIDRYTISETPQGLVRTVIVTEERTGEPVSLPLASTSLLALFAQSQPHPGEWIEVRYRWHAPDHSYQRWRLLMDRPETLDFSPLGGEASDEAPWHRERPVALAVAGSMRYLQETV